MGYTFRTDSIHSEVELIAREIDVQNFGMRAKNSRLLVWFVREYPNAETWRVVPQAKKHLLDEENIRFVRENCVEALGEIGVHLRDEKRVLEVVGILLNSLGTSIELNSIYAIGNIAREQGKKNLDSVASCLVKRLLDSGGFDSKLPEEILVALGEIKPNNISFLEDLRELRECVVHWKKRDHAARWDNSLRRLGQLEKKWKDALVMKGILPEERKVGFSGPGRLPRGIVQPKKRRAVLP